MVKKKKYVLVGTGGRCVMFINALAKEFKESGELLALCDTNQIRMNYYVNVLKNEHNYPELPTYKAEDFDKMIAEHKPDRVIVTSMDRTHHKYICRAMELGCDVVSEKPMTVDEEKCQQIIDTVKKTGRKLIVTFNYRYSPRNTKVKEIIKSGMVGDITSIHFEWVLSTQHGADYFRRWHRDKRNSGSLMVHKSTHHFDLVNWWIDSQPEIVFAMGDLKFYGKINAENRGIKDFYYRARNNEVAAKDPFALKVTDKDTRLQGLYYDAEHEDNYFRDQSVFSDGISIEDNIAVMVRYSNKVVMNYSLNAHSPWEGYRVCFNGTKGRLEFNVVETPYISGDHADFNIPGMHELDGELEEMVPEIIFQPHWGKAQVIKYEKSKGGHGGGDIRLLGHVFDGAEDDPLGHAAGYVDGAQSILTGIAANKSMQTGLPVDVTKLVTF
ncbi:MAG: Gfo/Idh/MocA family oxidoreductase [Lentisphaerae bacterium]|nr:Gfo/Idh/MocA family oxidoreductase [Lentisphaerota bacterium]MCP4103625.1 Gfo/Idh/MocA family oxidoreductase [Lentisphaerota bacterium]